MIGIILAGGSGTRLSPMSQYINKHLLPIYDKPMIYYPLSTLMLAGIRKVLLISNKNSLKSFKKLLGSGKSLGMKINYEIQNKPRGIAEALIIAKNFAKKNPITLILGDNLFYGSEFIQLLKKSVNDVKKNNRANFFSYSVSNPSNYGVVVKKKGIIKSFIEKPKKPISNQAVVGLYMFPNDCIKFAKKLKPSKRNELEITDLNQIYLKKKRVHVTELGRGYGWFDAGTVKNLFEASQLVRILEERMGFKIGCVEEVAYRNAWIKKNDILKRAGQINSEYFNYIKNI